MTPFELQLQQLFPDIYSLNQLMKTDNKLRLLIDTILKYNLSSATGSVIVDYSKGYISHIDTRIRITAETGR